MSESKLLRCPCCDSDADYDELHTVSEGSDCFFCEHHSYIIRCKGCGLTIISRTSKEDAVHKWNTRKPIQMILDKFRILFQHHSATKTVQRLVVEIVREVGGDNG